MFENYEYVGDEGFYKTYEWDAPPVSMSDRCPFCGEKADSRYVEVDENGARVDLGCENDHQWTNFYEIKSSIAYVPIVTYEVRYEIGSVIKTECFDDDSEAMKRQLEILAEAQEENRNRRTSVVEITGGDERVISRCLTISRR